VSKRDVVISGIACRLPGVKGPRELWQHLRSPTTHIEALSRERYARELYIHELPRAELDKITHGAFLDDFSIDFRALRIPPVQLEHMHRMDVLAVGTMCESLLDAGIKPTTVCHENAQVIIAAQGLGRDDHTDTVKRIRRFEMQEPVSRTLEKVPSEERADIDELVEQLFNLAAPQMEVDSLLTSSSIVAGRIANIFNFRGGHHAVDCGASSSLVAIQQGVDRIRAGEADIVVVAAFSPLLTASHFLRHCAAGLSGETFVLGEGCLSIVLQLASESAMSAYASITEVECSGTRTERDPEEMQAALSRTCARVLGQARFIASRAAGIDAFDRIERQIVSEHLATKDASVSSQAASFGHLQAASGMLAFVEATLAAKHGIWPKTGAHVSDEDVIAVVDAGVGAAASVAILRRPAYVSAVARQNAMAGTDIAIVGLGAMAPHASNVSELWANLLAGVDAIDDLPKSRFDAEKLIGSGLEAKSMRHTRLAGLIDLEALEQEDFGLPTSALRGQDPAVKLALAVVDESLKCFDASKTEKSRTDVVIGQIPLRAVESLLESRVLFAHHLALVRDALQELGWEESRAHTALAEMRAHFEESAPRFEPSAYEAFSGAACATFAARAHGLLGLTATVDAACASAHAAIKVGVDRLRAGRSDLVLAGGVAFNILPEFYIALSMLGFLSTDGAPPFSDASNGFVPAEGAGCVALKRKADAERDGDHIYAVIRGVGCSSDGRGQAVLAPNVAGQRLAVKRALGEAHVTPADIEVLEAHGAGTRAGDQVEMDTFADTYGRAARATPLGIGALKSQIGHTSSASSVLALIKATLALDHKLVPPSNLDEQPRPGLHFGEMGFEGATTRRQWFTLPGRRRHAAVNAIGMGGANYHIVLQRHDGGGENIDLRPALPPRGTYASRFVIDRVPMPLRDNDARSLGGQCVLVFPDAARIHVAVVAALERRGARVTVLPRTFSPSEISAIVARARGEGHIAGVVDVSTYNQETTLRTSPQALLAALEPDNARFFSLARAVYADLADHAGFYYAVTALGGSFGTFGNGDGDPLGASRQGFARALKQEVPQLDSKALDIASGTSPEMLASHVLKELDDKNDRMDVAYRSGERFVANFLRRTFEEDARALRVFGEGDVVLFSGGGRGVTFVCARALASRGVKVVVCGRSKRPKGDEPWLEMDDARFSAFRQDELLRRRKENTRLTPATFHKEFAAIASARELHRNLEQVQRLGLDFHYISCDVTDAQAVASMAKQVRALHGPITGVVHGAMVESSRSVPSKSDEIVSSTFSAKVAAFLHLWSATQHDPLRTFMCFGSGASRFGNRGQTDYAAANALMAHMLVSLATRDARGLHHCTLDWTAWEGTGAAVADAEIAALVKGTGVSSIRPEEGEYWFIRELVSGRSSEVLIFDERMLEQWPFIGSRADGAGERRRYQSGFSEVLVSGEFPLIDAIDGEKRFITRVFDASRDAFIDQHRLYETPILPATFGAELVAEAALALFPGYALESVAEFAIDTPVKLFRSESVTLRGEARILEQTQERLIVRIETASSLLRNGRVLQERRVHHAGNVTLRRANESGAVARVHSVIEPSGVARAHSFFHMARDPVALGPIFSRAHLIKVAGEHVFGRIRAPRMRDLFAHTSTPRFALDPMVMDSAFQIAANWDGLVNDFVSIPFAVERITLGRLRALDEEARVSARVVKVSDPDVWYDIVVTGNRDEVLLEIGGLHLRRIARIKDPGER
jgi:enediyne polyketide synthase